MPANRSQRRSVARNGESSGREVVIPKAAAARITAAAVREAQARALKEELINVTLEALGCEIQRDDGMVWNVTNESGGLVARLGPPNTGVPDALRAAMEAELAKRPAQPAATADGKPN